MLFSCSSNQTLLAQNKYKGAPKHQELSIDIFPDSTDYILDQSLESDLRIKLKKKLTSYLKNIMLQELQQQY